RARCLTIASTAACWCSTAGSTSRVTMAGTTSCSRADASCPWVSSRCPRRGIEPGQSGDALAAPPALVGQGQHRPVLAAVAVGVDPGVARQVVAGADVGDLVRTAVAAGIAAGQPAGLAFQAIAGPVQAG